MLYYVMFMIFQISFIQIKAIHNSQWTVSKYIFFKNHVLLSNFDMKITNIKLYQKSLVAQNTTQITAN